MLNIKFVCDVCVEKLEYKIEMADDNNMVVVVVPCKSCLNREYLAGAEAQKAGMV